MPRYIDADLILPEMESKLDMQELYLPVHFQEFIVGEIPTADVAPVRHGRWKQDILRVKAALSIVAQVYICSECGKPAKMQHNFCPHCGAKMDGKERDENDRKANID